MIVLNAIEKQFGSKILYDKLSASIDPAARTGLIGPNGAGKTVLMRMIAGLETPDRGQVSLPSQLKTGYLPQEMTFEAGITPLGLVLAPYRRLLDAASNLGHFDGDHADGRSLAKLDKLQTEIAIHDVYSLNARAQALLAGLGVPAPSWERDLHELSGGFRMRTLLAQILLTAPDFLLLDEPTNHLDMDSLIWLEKFLLRFKGGMLIISHDRDFLNRITTQTAELSGAALVQFGGPVSDYLLWKEVTEASEARAAANLGRQIAKTEAFVERFKAKATKASQARSKMKVLDKLREGLPAARETERTVRFRLPQPHPAGAVPLRLERVTIAYDRAVVFTDLSLTISRGDKIAVIGPNGAGKSTLLKACAGLLTPTAGAITPGYNAEIRYYGQHRLEQLDPGKTLFDTIAEAAGAGDRFQVQSILGAFLFSGDEATKTAGVCSGGEKARLSLAAILARPGNLLLLDEPTNHLDLQSVERLAEALDDYAGTLIMVSHDEFFVSRIANRIIEIRDGGVRDFPGTLGDYRSYIEAGYLAPLDDAPGPAASGQTAAAAGKEARVRAIRERKTLSRRIEKIERSVAELEQAMAETRAVLDDPRHSADHAVLHESSSRLARQETEHRRLIDQWERLHEALEELTVE